MDPKAQASRALELFHAGQFQEALDLAIPLVDLPDLVAEMGHLQGACLHQLGRSEEAVVPVRRAIAADANNASYINTLGVILRKLKRSEQAVRAYQRVIALDPSFADAYYNCGNALSELKRLEAAAEMFRGCLEHNPRHNSAHHNLANSYRDLRQLDLALEHYRLSDECQHHNPDMHCNWGLAWQLQERWDKAIDAFETAINLKVDHAPSHINLGGALAVQERFDEACAALRRGVELDQTCNDAKFNLGLTLLTIGQYEEGWKFYDTRLSLPDKVRPPLATAIWDGNLDIEGPLLVWAEQGYGDNIQFARYLPILMELGLQVTCATRPSLMELFRQCLQPACPAIIEHKPADLQAFTHHVPLLTLPRILKTSLETVPLMPGYLKAPTAIPERLKVARQPFALHIGLVWASGVDNKDMYADKSLPLELLLPIFDEWRNDRLVSLHSLQVGVDAQQLDPWRDQWGITDWNGRLESFLDTACVLSQLDLVITVDTAVAHLAGGLDRPTWLMLQHNADFRWLRGRSDTPWYPSMSLFRQSKLGDWPSAVAQLADRLKQLLG
ncbi:glycosyltransferase family protein [Cyanobium sp. HWJ4-Hawea]|uniref:tetratricopeptide repeat protein n=1 Tax=Cyanobium sp. HWJ4-Hawea TaxID=2823713 RepID=UPI0020CCFEB8|nr:tetratricopeptide repeat-containing glycosyltransferase family protein [Cyanobium sp. HWJ4-Hawea]MCP9809131.1 glycosyltransferase family protein [Cyanobium sp. HWJ4-Hawea]